MRIAALYYTHKPGGMCPRLYRAINALARDGAHSVCYLALDAPPSGSLDKAVEFFQIPFPLKQRCGLIFWMVFTLLCPWYLMFWIYKHGKPDKILAFGAYYSAQWWLVRNMCGSEIILFIRSLVFVNDRLNKKCRIFIRLSEALDRVGIALATKVVCMTRSMQAELEKFWGGTLAEAIILPNDLPVVVGDSDQQIKILSRLVRLCGGKTDVLKVFTSGVIDQRKNIGLLIEAMAKLSEMGCSDEIILIVAGDGPLKQQCQQMAKDQGLTSILFLGWSEFPTQLLSGVDLVLHSSLHEGMSNSVLEALAAKKPVLVSDIPEHREIFPENMLFSASLADDLAQRLAKLASDRSQLESLRFSSAEAASKLSFDWDARLVEIVLSASS